MLFEDWVFENYRVRGSSQWQLSDAECPFCNTTGSDVRLYFNKEAREDGTYGGSVIIVAVDSTTFSSHPKPWENP